jgi:Xaa-Pro dipeptidase
MGTAENYDEVLKGKYPAKTHAKKVKEWIVSQGGDAKGTVYLEGQKTKMLEVCYLIYFVGFGDGEGGVKRSG